MEVAASQGKDWGLRELVERLKALAEVSGDFGYETCTWAATALEFLEDPVAVHHNMLRGTIAKPSVKNIIHLYGREALEREINVPANGGES